MVERIVIRKGSEDDLEELQKLFADSIITVCSKDYDREQIRVWASTVENSERWSHIVTAQYLIVACLEGTIAGFASLEGNYLDMMYVHKDFQRMGIAQILFGNIEEKIIQDRHSDMEVHVSKTARPFFEAMGCVLVREQTRVLNGVSINNFIMRKKMIY